MRGTYAARDALIGLRDALKASPTVIGFGRRRPLGRPLLLPINLNGSRIAVAMIDLYAHR